MPGVAGTNIATMDMKPGMATTMDMKPGWHVLYNGVPYNGDLDPSYGRNPNRTGNKGSGQKTTFAPMTGSEQRVFDAARIAALSRLAQAQNEQANEGLRAQLKYLADENSIKRSYADERSNANVAAGSRGLALSPATMGRLAQSLMNRQATDTARAKQVELDRKAALQKNTDAAGFNYLQVLSDLAQQLANKRGETASTSLMGTY